MYLTFNDTTVIFIFRFMFRTLLSLVYFVFVGCQSAVSSRFSNSCRRGAGFRLFSSLFRGLLEKTLDYSGLMSVVSLLAKITHCWVLPLRQGFSSLGNTNYMLIWILAASWISSWRHLEARFLVCQYLTVRPRGFIYLYLAPNIVDIFLSFLHSIEDRLCLHTYCSPFFAAAPLFYSTL